MVSLRQAALHGLLVAVLTVGGSTSLRAGQDHWLGRAGVAASYLDQQWRGDETWQGAEPWQRFVIVDALLDYESLSRDRQYHNVVSAFVRNRSGLTLNDDFLWAAIASIHVWQREGDLELLTYAQMTFDRIVGDYWDDHCGGGLWWDQARTYKNAITNELLIYAATQMFHATGADHYRTWALRGWSWLSASKMIGADGLVNDGLDADCHNNGQPRYTYNQGVLIGALNDLTKITGDPQYLAIAVKLALATKRTLTTPEEILREPVDELGLDGVVFKGVFAGHLGRLLDSMPTSPERSELSAWAQLNAHAVWLGSARGSQAITSRWSEQASPSGPAAQASGIEILLAAAR
ncbi:glycosyl hydrolase [Novosphingobium flavum]|uniref:Glycosyl hydrolase n=1 Tax=Novosphingobium flavum TaxID=1778672 RepID=A0A7X1KLY9_9SPHN|nr:glycoside hydrolase family 76 protein [Novosphingobium flavum]MBC2665745.1 glycosyl hydrolase [Novosphingobium flavum]